MHELTHERTYLRKDPSGLIHRARLSGAIRLLMDLPLPGRGSFAEFGCSNGFVLDTLRRAVFPWREYTFTGFDHDDELLDGARAKGLPQTEFHHLDLNADNAMLTDAFSIVFCVEVLEHVGDYTAAIRTLYRACKPGGLIVIGVPNETGWQGTMKFLGRYLLRPNPYTDFFDQQSQRQYLLALLRGAPLDRFRLPVRRLWHQHLGFDTRVFEGFLRAEMFAKEAKLLRRMPTALGCNLFWAFQKPAVPPLMHDLEGNQSDADQLRLGFR